MRNHLNGLAQVIAAPLLFEHVRIYPPRTHGIGDPRGYAGEAFIMTKIEISFRPVIGDEDLAMLERRHGAGIDVEIGIKLAQPYRKASRLQERAKCRRGKSLAKRGHNAAGDENVTCHARGAPRDVVIW